MGNTINSKRDEIYEWLLEEAEEDYKKFASSLLPGVDNLLGVRIPTIRKKAKQLVKEDVVAYLNEIGEDYFEEIMLKGFLIAQAKWTVEERIHWIRLHIPKLSNWSLCDSFCSSLKEAKKEKKIYWELVEEYLRKDSEYELRFAIVMILQYFLNPLYSEKIFQYFDNINKENYYVRKYYVRKYYVHKYYVHMAIAWAISICYKYNKTETMEYLKNNQLYDHTYNKAIQKILELKNIETEEKIQLKKMKR